MDKKLKLIIAAFAAILAIALVLEANSTTGFFQLFFTAPLDSTCSIRILDGTSTTTNLVSGKTYNLEITVTNTGTNEWFPLWNGFNDQMGPNLYKIGAGTGEEQGTGFLNDFNNGWTAIKRLPFPGSPIAHFPANATTKITTPITPIIAASQVLLSYKTLQETVAWFGSACSLPNINIWPPENCTNNSDDDHDGLTDCQAPDCPAPTSLTCDALCQTKTCSTTSFDWECTNKESGTICGTRFCGADYCEENIAKKYSQANVNKTCQEGTCIDSVCILTSTNCGTTKSCLSGACANCPTNTANCDQKPATGTSGCEVKTDTNSQNCGTCGTVCAVGSGCNQGICTAAPKAPSNFTATAASTTAINLSWTDNSNNETKFDILRKTSNTEYARIAQPTANSTSYQNTTGLTAGTTYFYAISSFIGTVGSMYVSANATTGQCTTSTASIDCNDNNPCTTDSCSAAHSCVNAPTAGAVCYTGNFCDTNRICGQKTCSASGECNVPALCVIDCPNAFGQCGIATCSASATLICTNPIRTNQSCDDSNALTGNDACNSAGICIGTRITPNCIPNWSCSEWGACQSNNVQTRTCIDLNSCVTTSRPDETKNCNITQPQCTTSADCNANKYCSGSNCTTLNCSATQRAENHVCVDIPPVLPECTADSDCTVGKECNTTGHCESIQCPAGKILQGSQCITQTTPCTGILCSGICHLDDGVCCNNNWNENFESCTVKEVNSALSTAEKTTNPRVNELADKAKAAQDNGELQKSKAYSVSTIALFQALGNEQFKTDSDRIYSLLELEKYTQAETEARTLLNNVKKLPVSPVNPDETLQLIIIVGILGIIVASVLAWFFVLEKKGDKPEAEETPIQEVQETPRREMHSKSEEEMQKILKDLKNELK